jgi:hypothetical protein
MIDSRYKPGSFGCHEALHTTWMLMDMTERYLANHRTIEDNEEWSSAVSGVLDSFWNLYQLIGAEHLEASGEITAS